MARRACGPSASPDGAAARRAGAVRAGGEGMRGRMCPPRLLSPLPSIELGVPSLPRCSPLRADGGARDPNEPWGGHRATMRAAASGATAGTCGRRRHSARRATAQRKQERHRGAVVGRCLFSALAGLVWQRGVRGATAAGWRRLRSVRQRRILFGLPLRRSWRAVPPRLLAGRREWQPLGGQDAPLAVRWNTPWPVAALACTAGRVGAG